MSRFFRLFKACGALARFPRRGFRAIMHGSRGGAANDLAPLDVQMYEDLIMEVIRHLHKDVTSRKNQSNARTALGWVDLLFEERGHDDPKTMAFKGTLEYLLGRLDEGEFKKLLHTAHFCLSTDQQLLELASMFPMHSKPIIINV